MTYRSTPTAASKTLTVRLDGPIYDAVTTVAGITNSSIALVINTAIAEYVTKPDIRCAVEAVPGRYSNAVSLVLRSSHDHSS